MTKLHQVLPKACEDYFYIHKVTRDRLELLEIYSELLRIKFGALHEYLVLKLKSAFSSWRTCNSNGDIYTDLLSATLC